MKSNMNITCPHCYATFSLESASEDICARELFALLRQSGTGSLLIAYLGLFTPRTQALRWSRALALATDVMALSADHAVLCLALRETVEAFREKRQLPTWKPLTGHGYLQRVLENTSVNTRPITTDVNANKMPSKPASKTAQTIALLENYITSDGVPEWFTRTVCDALSELMVMGLENVPAADTMNRVVERWLKELWPKRQWKENDHFCGAKRLRTAIVHTAEHNKRWPQTREVLDTIPR